MDTLIKMDTLDIVSFSQNLGKELDSLLLRQGFRTNHLNGEQWLNTDDGQRKGIAILIVNNEVNTDKITAKLACCREQQYIGILDCKPSSWSSDLINQFDEFIHWPCHQEELLCRLNRLRPQRPTPLLNSNKLLEEFSTLSMIGKSNQFVSILMLIKKIARYNVPTLITGETGTGKEMAARAIHYLGARRDAPFIPVNCGAIPDNLLENELFGHEKGAYTDAKEAQPGVVQIANGGTLFLDEIDTLSQKAQVALLRLIQAKEYRPLGSRTVKHADIRIIAATNKDLKQLTASHLFREDLLFRLNVLCITMPPLRNRVEDIEILANHLLIKISQQYGQPIKQLHKNTLSWMKSYSWPGNVRELENILHREFLLSEGAMLKFKIINTQHQERRSGLNGRRVAAFKTNNFNHAKAHAIATFERSYLHWLMEATQGNISKAARKTGKERRALGRLLKKHNIDKARFMKTG
ncbi:sigma-54 interaction domain-containing protein [Pseudomonadota bacterium]